MGSNGGDEISRGDETEGSETTIEITIKTLDSQTYTLRVNKRMPVLALKARIASVSGVLSGQQRLICRGKVLRDDELLSAYHVEDGHTLHLVVRQPPPSSESLPNHPADPASNTSRGQGNQTAPHVVLETLNMPDLGDGVLPELSRIVSAVLGPFRITNIGSGSEGVVVREHGPERFERTLDASVMTGSTQLQPEQASMRVHSDRLHSAFQLPAAVTLGPLEPPVIPDSLTTLFQYLSRMRHEFSANGRGGGNNAETAAMHGTEERESNSTLHSRTLQEGLPTPTALAEVMLATRQMLVEQIGECLLQIARQLEIQANVTDPTVRLSTQSSAWRTGVLFQNLGAFLLELGRTTMTLRLGRTPSEGVVNSGPAVFISPSGPNPLMVQPLPFRPGTNFGATPRGIVHPGSGSVNALGVGFLPRRIDIQIQRGQSMPTANVNQEGRAGSQQPSGQRNPETNSGGENHVNQPNSRASEGPSFTAVSGLRVVPIRTMVAAVPGTLSGLPSDSSSTSLGFYYPVGRFQHVTSGHLSNRRGSEASGEHHPSSFQTEQQPIPESAVQQQNIEATARDGLLPTPNLRQQEPLHPRNFNIDILSNGGIQNILESGGQISSGLVQLLRNLFPGGEIHVEDAIFQETATGSVAERAGTTSGAPDAQEAEPRVSDEGIFLSSLLHQIMPFITQLTGAEPNVASPEEANASEHTTAPDSSTQAENSDVGTSRRQSDRQPSPPNSKRQKME